MSLGVLMRQMFRWGNGGEIPPPPKIRSLNEADKVGLAGSARVTTVAASTAFAASFFFITPCLMTTSSSES